MKTDAAIRDPLLLLAEEDDTQLTAGFGDRPAESEFADGTPSSFPAEEHARGRPLKPP